MPSLDLRPLKQLKNSNELPTGQSKNQRCHQDLHLTSTGDRRLRRQRRSQYSLSRAGQACPAGPDHGTASLAVGFSGGGHENTDDVPGGASPALWLVDPPEITSRLDSADLGPNTGGISGMELRPGDDTGHGRWALPNPPRPMSRSFPSAIPCLQGWKRLEPGSSRPRAPGVVVLLVARWLAEHNQKLLGLYFCLLFKTYIRPPEDWRCGPALYAERNSWSRGKVVTAHPSERASPARQNRRVRHERIAGRGKTPVHVSRPAVTQRHTRRKTAPFSLLVHAKRQRKWKTL